MTTEGHRLYDSSDPAHSYRLHQELARLALNTFGIFGDFLLTLHTSPYRGVVGIPYLSAKEFEKYRADPLEKLIDRAVQEVYDLLQPRFALQSELYEQYRNALEMAVSHS